MQLFDLEGRCALVTGSSRGIGLVLAEGLARAGARVVLNGRDPATLAAARDALAARGVEAEMAPFDVTEAGAVANGVAAVESTVAPIDILVNCAAMQHRASLEAFPAERWRDLFRVNVESAFLVAQAVARGMIERRRGKIVNICSVQSELGRPGIAPYAATKGALRMLTRGMCADWARHDIQVNGLAPGYFRTDMTRALVDDPAFSMWLTARTPAGRWGDTNELVGACVFLASPASSFVNGHILYVDGGLTSVV